jgi:hypothetical protein
MPSRHAATIRIIRAPDEDGRRSAYRSAIPVAGAEMEELIRSAERAEWPGYFGSPRLASTAHGARIWQRAAAVVIGLGLQILDGLDGREIRRFSVEMLESPADVRLDRASLEHEARVQRRQEEWLRSRSLQ